MNTEDFRQYFEPDGSPRILATRDAALVGSGDGFGSVFAPLEAALSPHAKHALEAYQIAFWQPEQTMTVRELRTAIRRIYGEAVDRELEQHLSDRRDAVLPNIAGQPRRSEA